MKILQTVGILLLGAFLFSACSKDNKEKSFGIDTTNRNDNYNDMESIVESLPFSQLLGVSVGNAQDNDAKTGVTVFFFPKASMVMEKAIADAILSSKIPDEEYLANI